MEIVPLNEQVVVDVQVAPTDIDSVALGQKAEVRFSSSIFAQHRNVW